MAIFNELKFFVGKDYQNEVNIESDTNYNCEEFGCDGVCRCSTIENARVGYIDARWMASNLNEGPCMYVGANNIINNYLADRLVKLAMKPDMFDINVCGGYYGEEIDSVKVNIHSSEYKEFAGVLESFNRCQTMTQRIQMILTLEYKYLLPELAAVEEWDVLSLPITRVHADKGVLSRVSRGIVKEYHHHPPVHGITGVVVNRDDGDYRLVDGFHRYSAWILQPQTQYGHGQSVRKPKHHTKITVLAPKPTK